MQIVQKAAKFCSFCRRHLFLTQILLVLLFRLTLDILYVAVLSPHYAYSGFTVSIEPLFYLCTWLSLFIFAPFIVSLSNQHSPSALIVTFLNYLFFIPLTSFGGCYGSDVRFYLIALIFWAVLLFLQFKLPVLHLKQPDFHASRRLMVWLTVLSCIFVMYISGRYTGFRFTLDVIDVYGIRREAAAYDLPVVASYLLSMMPIIFTILLSYWIDRKKWSIVIVLCIVYLFLFSINAQKSTFFLLILVLFCRFFYRDWMLRWAAGFLTLFNIVSIAEEKILGTFFLMANFIRRMMYLPLLICEQYYEFFQQNPQNLYRDGIMGKLSFSEIYSTVIPRVIGEYRGHEMENANSGLLGDLFANLPTFPGIILLPLILIVCFRLLDMTAHSLRSKILIPICFYYACIFLSGFWSTSLLSNGFLLTCLLLYIYPNKEELSHA